jgi:murein DD-endopeptidase MepM/ murein hydrolase activator NlpD
MRKLPDTIHEAYHIKLQLERLENNDWLMQVANPVACPLRISFESSNEQIDPVFRAHFPKVVEAYGVVRVTLPAELTEQEIRGSLKGNSGWSHLKPVVIDTSTTYLFPFPPGKAYSIVQGYSGTFSHNTPFSHYAIDFKMPIGDTICAARDGVVVGLVEDNEDWIHGRDQRYRSYANMIRLYHADETYTDYVHLKHKGALVAMGDTVRAGQPIAISGYTGWTSLPHLHFNVLKPTADGDLESFPIRFEKVAGKDLRDGVKVAH